MKSVAAIASVLLIATSQVAVADVAAGKAAYASKGCIGCHGANGVSTVAANPSLAGKDAAFVQKNLTEFRAGTRQSPVMNAMASALTDDDINNLAEYIATLK